MRVERALWRRAIIEGQSGAPINGGGRATWAYLRAASLGGRSACETLVRLPPSSINARWDGNWRFENGPGRYKMGKKREIYIGGRQRSP